MAQGAAKSGNRAQAFQYFSDAVEAGSTRNEDAWLGKASQAPSLDDAITCLHAVLVINPDNERARQGLAAAERARVPLSACLIVTPP